MEPVSSTRDLRLIRLHYFLLIGAGGFLAPFVTLFYKARGLSGTEIGLLSTFSAVAAMLAAPLWGRWGDSARHPRRLIMLALLGTAVFALLRGLQSLFWSIALFIILDGLVTSGAGTLANIQALAVTNGEKSGFGSIRLWGSLGWALVTPFAGGIIQSLGLYVPFAGYAAVTAAAACVLFFMCGPARPQTTARPLPVAPVAETLRALVRDRTIMGMAAAFTIIWIAGMGRGQFETLYMNQLGASPTTIGIANTVAALFEVPFMLWADRLIQRFGAGRILSASILVQAVSYLPVVLIPTIPSFFVSRVLVSIAFSLTTPAYYNFLVNRAPQGKGGTIVSLFDVTLHNGVNLLAAPLAGSIFDAFGPHWLYVAGTVGCLAGWAILQSQREPPVPA